MVVFFDDLDQAVLGEQETDVAPVFRQVLELRPCIPVGILDGGALIENVTREAGERLDLKPLKPEFLVDVMLRRLDAAADEVRKQFPPGTDWSATRGGWRR